MRDPMRLKISHTTRYEYDQPVPYGLQQLRLTPASGATQRVIDWSLNLGTARQESAFRDQHGNEVRLVSLPPDTRSIEIVSTGEVETTDTAGVSGPHTGAAPLWYYRRQTGRTRPGPVLNKLLKTFPGDHKDAIESLHALMTHVAEAVDYDTDTTHAETTAEIAAKAGSGVCQDHAHIFIGLARALGHPARYVSGYLKMDGQRHQDASHAWSDVHIEGLGWVGFNVSNRISPDTRYVRIATGLDYAEAAPISGFVFGGGEESMMVTLQIQQ